MKKLFAYSLAGLLTLSCSVSAPNNSFQSEVTGHWAPVKEDFSALAKKYNFAELENEYKSFSTKALSNAYVKRMFIHFLETNNGAGNPVQIIRQLEFARYLEIIGDSSYADAIKSIIADDSTVYDKITALVAVVNHKTENPATFGTFIDNLAPPASSNIIFVKENASGNNSGTSWTNAYTSLQSALSAAVNGKNIWIAAGTFKPGIAVTDSFQLKSGVNIYGGFAGTETHVSQRNYKSNVVILSGDINNSGTANEGDSYHVVKGSDNSILDGVTIKFGYASGGNDYAGGGFICSNSSPTVKNVIFSNNYALYFGGGMYNENSSPIMENVTFTSNSALGGGGITNLFSSPVITNAVFSGNDATVDTGQGGAIFNYESPSVITNAIFINNHSSELGGAIANVDSSSVITNALFSGNSARYGGAICSPSKMTNPNLTLTNTTFYNNSATDYPGGALDIYRIEDDGAVSISTSVTIKNSVFYGNTAPASQGMNINMYNIGSIINIGYSDVEGGFAGITGSGAINNLSGSAITDATGFSNAGNINANPLFVSTSALIGADGIWMTSDDGLRLMSGSPARNTGTNTGAPATDIIGTTRPKGTGYDMGAYEFVE